MNEENNKLNFINLLLVICLFISYYWRDFNNLYCGFFSISCCWLLLALHINDCLNTFTFLVSKRKYKIKYWIKLILTFTLLSLWTVYELSVNPVTPFVLAFGFILGFLRRNWNEKEN